MRRVVDWTLQQGTRPRRRAQARRRQPELMEYRITARRIGSEFGRIGSEFDSDRLHIIRVRFWRGAARPVVSQHIARASSRRRHKGCREARNRADRDDGCAGPRPVDRLGEEHLRHASKPVIAGLCRRHPARPPLSELWAGDEGGAGAAPTLGHRRARAVLAGKRQPARKHRSKDVPRSRLCLIISNGFRRRAMLNASCKARH